MTYLTAREAAEKLNISLATLYAYVSRGMIHAIPAEDGTRQKRYLAADVERLITRKQARRTPDAVVESALNWGMPMLESAITLINGGQLFYRGRDVIQLAQEASVEQVAALLWADDPDMAERLFALENRTPPPACPESPDYARLQVVLAFAAQEDYAAYDLRPESVMMSGARILRLMVETLTGRYQPGVAEALAAAWCTDAAHLFSAALILCADHELNASSFAARVVASAGATPYAAVGAGLAALSGVHHGGMTGRVEAFLREVAQPEDAANVIAERLRRGESIPGFGHRLYPDGDPRGAALLALLHDYAGDRAERDRTQAVIEAVESITGEKPSIDFALVAMARQLGVDKPLVIFALGRVLGWIAHAIEQIQTGEMIRPRARYTGKLP